MPSETTEVASAVALLANRASPTVLRQDEQTPSVQIHESSWVMSPRADSCGVGGPVGPYIDPCCNPSFRGKVYDFTAGINYSRFDIAEATRGQPFEAVFKFTSPDVQGFGVTFLKKDDTMTGYDTGVVWPLSLSSGRVEGIVPSGATAALAWSCLSGPVSVRYEAEMQQPARSLHGVTASWIAGTHGPECYTKLERPDITPSQTTQGIDHASFAVPAATRGSPFRAGAHHVLDTVNPIIVVNFFDKNHEPIKSIRAGAPFAGNVAVASGTVPPDATHAELWSCVSGPVTTYYRAGGNAS